MAETDAITAPSRRRALPWLTAPLGAAGAVGAGAGGIFLAALVVGRMEFGRKAEKWERINLATHRSLPVVEPVLDCGRLGLVGRRRVGGTISQLAASTRTPLSRFERVEPNRAGRYAGVLVIGKQEARLPPAWPIRETEPGSLAVNPDCSAGAG